MRFPNGSTPNGTVATNTADGVNLGASPGTFTTPPVNVTAVATVQVTLAKTLLTAPANLDLPESYRLRISVPNVNGTLNLTAIGPITDTLPPGAVFNGATPAADCQPGCVGTTPATVTWSNACTVPLQPNQNCDVTVNVTFPSATFPSGTNVTNSFTATATPLGQPPQNFGPGTITHPVTTFVAAPGAGFTKNMANGTPNPPTLNQLFSYDLNLSNSGNVPLDNLVVIDTLPVEMQLVSVGTGAYNGLANFAAGEGVRVSYEKNTAPGVFTLWGSSPNTTTNTTLTAPPPGLGAGEYITRVRWEYGQAQAGMSSSTRPLLSGRIVNPDNAGGPVAIGDSVQNCAALTSVYTAGPTSVNRNDCESFTVAAPFVQLNPAKENLSGGGPFNPGQNVSWRLRVRSDARSSDPVPLDSLVSTDLLPVNLTFSSWTFDAQGTGLPAPQVFEQIPNFAGTGRTLLRWRWNAGSGSLGVNQQVWINVATQIRSGAPSGNLANDFTLETDAPGLAQRCTAQSQTDALDFDGDGNTAETLCRATGTIGVAGIAQLISSKVVQGVCDAGGVASSAGTLTGGSIAYRLRVQNVGTVPMQNTVLVDILPFVGDTGVRDTSPRGSQWTPLLASPISPPPGTTIFYSTSGNPCRGEVGGPTTSCDAPNWTAVPPEPISSVRAFKVEFGDRVIQPFDFLEFDFSMTTPGSVPAGANAFNSFAYQADRADGLGSLAAEPQKVALALGNCAAASLGDRVFIDVDRDGIQDDGPTGLNGVYTRLVQPGLDGLVGTFDDVAIAAVTTSDGPGGEPGWYRFPGLAPGNYAVCIATPPTYDITTPNAGADDALDSDASIATACSPLVNLSTDEDDPTIDFGLVATNLAALGNYVWFDRNANGVQDESPYDGANGVTVRLYVDDGDGVPEPGTGDVLAAATVTGDDIYGNPGYYLFDDLTPGIRYLVEFVRPASATGFTAANAGGDDTSDSDAAAVTGLAPTLILAPGEVNRTVDAGLAVATGTLSLGDQVWTETDDDGVFEPQNGELGVDGVRLDLYRDANADGAPSLDEFAGTTASTTASGFAGRYRFDDLAPGAYVVVVSPLSFTGGRPLQGYTSASGNDPAPDPDDDVNGDDNGTDVGALTATRAVTLTDNGEPTSEDGNNDTNLTVDLGFVPAVAADPPVYDYGDAPDVVAGTAARDYRTTALDGGANHALVAGAPFLGACVDADGGFAQNVDATGDDLDGGAARFGTCAGNDDEDGVAVPGLLLPGAIADFAVTVGGGVACDIDAWVDWNQNGVFGDPGERIANGVPVAPGPAFTLSPTVPADAVPGRTYARFRCTTAGGVDPDGPAADGEVEDHLVAVAGEDHGDAAASYGDAMHRTDPLNPLLLGLCVDTETAAQPSALADGDDVAAGTSRIGSCFDDEDGVTFTAPVLACQAGNAVVTANRAGIADAWIDFSGDGDFLDAGERILTAQAVTAGANPVTFPVPCSATSSLVARFRLSSAGVATPDGVSPDGEVEDHLVTANATDFGDAPATYGTLLADNGARHDITSGFSLGATVDADPNGQPSADANGDGIDEDGVALPASLARCGIASIPVTLTNGVAIDGAVLHAWIDFDRDGVFQDARDRVANGVALDAGVNAIAVAIPCDAASGSTYARFRLSTQPLLPSIGPAPVGEVEDYAVSIAPDDFGDARVGYGTSFAEDGARHSILANGPLLGACVDTELDGAPSLLANGDDTSAGTSTVGTCAVAGDDEDGVAFPTALVPGSNGSVVVTAGAVGGVLQAWIDFDRDLAFEAGEQVATDRTLAANEAATIDFAVPATTTAGALTARLRIATTNALGPIGPAPNGEVEDHLVAVVGTDFGDAPATYGTIGAGAASHRFDPTAAITLGTCVDSEADGQPNAAANGDDLGASAVVVGNCTDDEDGVVFNAPLAACQVASVTVTASAASRLDAFVDFNADGDFADANERIANAAALVAGPNTISFDTPCDAVPGASYARFRVSAAGGLASGGAANDGEVEDYAIAIGGADFGDAPAGFPTTLAQSGAFHAVAGNASLFLGSCVDTESNGVPSVAANGDDAAAGIAAIGNCLVPGDDEDGVTLPVFTACQASDVNLVASAAGLVDAWIDWNGDGDWTDAGEQVATSRAVVAGSNVVPVTASCAARAGEAAVRFRVSTAGGASFGGGAADGEVEDYLATVQAVDFGDATAAHGTTLAADGARHVVLATGNPALGPTVDGEPDGAPTPNATGDDVAGVDDEDGVAPAGALFAGNDGTVNITTGAVGGRVSGWIDFDRDGTFEAAERVATDLVVAAGTTTPVTFTIPATSFGSTLSRWRIASSAIANPTGLAADGEVEDHALTIVAAAPRIGVAKRVASVETLGANEYRVTYRIVAANFGNVVLSSVTLRDDLAATFAGASFVVRSVTATGATANAGYDGRANVDLIAPGATLAPGASLSVDLVVDVTPSATIREYRNQARATGTSPDTQVVSDDSQDGVTPDVDGDGETTDDNVPTPVVFGAVSIPTLSTLGLVLFAGLAWLCGYGASRRRIPHSARR